MRYEFVAYIREGLINGGAYFREFMVYGHQKQKSTPPKTDQLRRLIFGLRREARGHNWVRGNHKGSFFIYFFILKPFLNYYRLFGGVIKIRLRC